MKVNKKIVAAIILAVINGNIVSPIFNLDIVEATSISQSTIQSTKTGTVVKAVNLRSEPNKTTSRILTLLPVGARLEVFDKVGEYYKVKYNNTYGYVYNTYIKVSVEAVDYKIYIAKKKANVRTRPDTTSTSNVIRVTSIGEEVKVVGESGSYYKIKEGSGYGYVYKTYFELKAGQSETPTEPKPVEPEKPEQKPLVVEETYKVYIAQRKANVRTQPTTAATSKVIRVTSMGEEVKVVGESGSYYKIKEESGYGYVYKTYFELKAGQSDDTPISPNPEQPVEPVEPEKPEENLPIVEEKYDVYIVRRKANVRTRPTTSNTSTVIRNTVIGEEVKVVGEYGSYYKIKEAEGYAYVYKSYCMLKDFEIEAMNSIGMCTSDVSVNKNIEISTSNILGTLSMGSKIEVVDKINNIYKVKFNGQYGYCDASLIEVNGEYKLDTIEELVIIVESAECRELATVDSAVAATVNYKGRFNVVEKLEGWYKIELEEGYAYIEEINTRIVQSDWHFVTKDDKLYYLSPDEFEFKAGYQVIDGVPYYFDLETGCSRGQLVKVDEMEENGEIVTYRYYVLNGGGYLKNKKRIVNNNTYYFGEDGRAIRGIHTIGEDTYFFSPNSGRALKGVCSLKDKLYYLDEETGIMKTNTTAVIGDKVLVYFGEDGVAYKYEALDDSVESKIILSGIDKLGMNYDRTLVNGLDCSGLVWTLLEEQGEYVFNQTRLTSHKQALLCIEKGLNISLDKLQVGDLIFYNNEECEVEDCKRIIPEENLHIHHVAIYLGDGKVLESSGGMYKTYDYSGVRIADVNLVQGTRTYYPRFAARVIGYEEPIIEEPEIGGEENGSEGENSSGEEFENGDAPVTANPEE